MSVKPSVRSRSSATYSGAMQTLPSFTSRTVVVSRAPSAAAAGGARRRPAAPASERPVRKPRRVCVLGIKSLPPFGFLGLQLEFELVEEAPIRVLGDELLRGGVDQPRLVQAQGVEAERVLRVVLPPNIVADLAQ